MERIQKKKPEKVNLKKIFRFKSFTERIANIKIDVVHQVGFTPEAPEDRDTFCAEALQKWKELNCTLDFVAFHREVRDKVDSLAQLIHHKDEVVLSLQRCLQLKGSLAYEPLLDLVVQLAKDLQLDFYPHFKGFFPILISLCNTQNADLIQNIFTTLAYLFKFLWRYMLRDIQNVYSMYSEFLLQSQRPHIRHFAVESFGFLLRKVQDQDSLFDVIFSSLAEDPELTDGVGQLLFEVCKGVPKQFHSCTEKVFPLLLRKLGHPHLPTAHVFQALTKMVELMAEHTRKEFSEPLWTPLLSHLSQLHSQWREGEGDVLSRQLAHTLHLVGVMVSWRKGSRIANGNRVAQLLLSIISDPALPPDVLSVSLHLAASLLLVSPTLPECGALLERVVRGVCERREEREVGMVMEFFQELAVGFSEFEMLILPECLNYCEAVIQGEENRPSTVQFLCELCLHFDPRYSPVSTTPSSFTLDLDHLSSNILKTPTKRTTRSHKTANMAALKSHTVSVLKSLVDSGLESLAEMEDPESEEGEKMNQLQTTWAALVCLQYIRPVPQPAIESVRQLYCALKDVILKPTPEGCTRVPEDPLLIVFSQTLSTLAATLEDRELTDTILLSDVLDALRHCPASVAILRGVDGFVSRIAESTWSSELLSADNMVEFLSVLLGNLSAPSSPVRLLTLKILCSFEQLSLQIQSEEELTEDGEVPETEVLKYCLRAEQIPAEFITYREKLLWLRKLKYLSHRFKQLPEVYREVPLRYLCGMLYVNFSLVWEPVCDIISTYAVEENMKLFWDIFGKFLEAASELAETPASNPQPPESSSHWHSSIPSLFEHQLAVMRYAQHGRPDHANFRRLLWKCVGGFPKIAEPRSRILVPLFFRFIQNEYALREDNWREFQDLRKRDDGSQLEGETSNLEETNLEPGEHSQSESGSQGNQDTAPDAVVYQVGTEQWDTAAGTQLDSGAEEEGLERMEVDGERESVDESEAGGSGREKAGKKGRKLRQRKEVTAHGGGRGLTKTLKAMLTVFSKFHNPKAFYKQEELRQLYMKLLTHKDSEVQMLALSCLMTYKPPYLLPYQENFERLLDNTSFREELVNFSVDAECSVVAEEHRESLMPVLVRILYGQMLHQGGHNTTKAGGAARRGTVLRFLAGCQGNEMSEFLNLLLLPFQSLMKPPPNTEIRVDASRVILLKKQQGFLNMLGQIISIFGSKAEPFLPTLLSLLLKLALHCAQLLSQRHLIQPHYVNALKMLRQLSINRISECFESFMEYDLSPFEEAVFNSVVWPQVLKLPRESIQYPTPLLKLLFTWSKYPRYFHLLAKPIPASVLQHSVPSSSMATPQPTAILHYVYSCLFSPLVSRRVCSCVMEMTVNLLGGQGEGEGERKGSGLEAMVKQGAQSESGGSGLVAPFIPTVLEYLNSTIKRGSCRPLTSEGGNLQLEFSVLSRISSFVYDTSDSSLLVELLLSFLLDSAEKHMYKKHEESILQTICNLVPSVEATGVCRPLSQLFSLLSARQSRTILCTIFQEIARKNSQWKSTADIITKLNAWDSRHIEEPAYQTRMEGFLEAKQLLNSPEGWDVTTVLPVLHNAVFFLLQSEDMSIRDAAASYVTELINHIRVEDVKAFRELVMSTVVGGVKQGLRSKQQFARHESISILAQLVRTYPSHHRFSDMTVLTHKDPEADFFENVRHIQLHRRTRALRKLAGACAEGLLSQHSLMAFLLPLANQVVFTHSSNMEQNLVAEAITVIGGVASCLKWANYCFLLQHYLRQLPKRKDIQKTLIRVVVAILDAFHFDLSGAQPLEREREGASESEHRDEGDPNKPETHSPGDKLSDTTQEQDDTTGEGESASVSAKDQQEAELDVPGEGEVKGVEPRAGGQRSASAQRIHRTIVNTILPSLQGVLTKKIDIPGHKLSRLKQDEQSEILRVPVAMAMTKLLLSLPESTLHAHLPSLLLKVCQTLKNRSHDVRDIARDTLVKMANALGPKYLLYILREMRQLLTRGYQLHVLSYSLHSVLKGVSTTMRTGDLDPCLEVISQILIEDLFGVPAEEREIGETVARIPESKTPQSLNSYELVTQFLSPSLLPELLAPVKQALEVKSSSRVARMVEEVFRRVGLGIQSNEGFTPQALLVFVHGVIGDSIPQLTSKPASKPKVAPSPLDRPDSYLLPPTPGRSRPKPASQGNITAHLVTEFGLQLLQTTLKRGKFDTSSQEQLQMLDPFVPLLSASLSSRHVKVLSKALHCVIGVTRMPLPSLDSNIQHISSHLFDILKRYARTGAAVGSNRDLVLAAFKAMTVILRDFSGHEISEDELKILLSFVEEDIYDYLRQSTAFPLLKAILGRRLQVPELYELMHKVAQLSVTSATESVRQQSRQAIIQFVMDYPLGKKLHRYLDFYVTNLSYEEQSGRESAIELLNVIFNKFPEKLLRRHATYFFVPLASQLVNDESPTCRQMIAETIKALLKRVDSAKRNDIVSIIEVWMEHERLIHKRLAVQTLGLLVEVEGKTFEGRLLTFLPLLLECLVLYELMENEEVGDAPVITSGDEEDMEVEDGGETQHGHKKPAVESTEVAMDHLLFSTLSTLEKICTECPVLRVSTYCEHMNNLWGKVHSLLLHPHTWVRLSASRLFGQLFAAYQPEELASPVEVTKKGKKGKKGKKAKSFLDYILQDGVSKVQDLCHTFCMQLSSPLLTSELANQAVKNLVFLSKVLHRLQLAGRLPTTTAGGVSMPRETPHTDHEHHAEAAASSDQGNVETTLEEEERTDEVKDLGWLIGRLSRLAKYEAGRHPKESLKRTCVLQWVAAVSVDLGQEHLPSHLPALLRPLFRELADSSKKAGEALYNLAQEVVELMKRISGREAFARAYSEVHQAVLAVREKRKKQAALEAVANPEKNTRRKQKKNLLKRASKRRKILSYRPSAKKIKLH